MSTAIAHSGTFEVENSLLQVLSISHADTRSKMFYWHVGLSFVFAV